MKYKVIIKSLWPDEAVCSKADKDYYRSKSALRYLIEMIEELNDSKDEQLYTVQITSMNLKKLKITIETNNQHQFQILKATFLYDLGDRFEWRSK